MEYDELMAKTIDLWYFNDDEKAIGIIPHPIEEVVQHYSKLIGTNYTKFDIYPYDYFYTKKYHFDIKYLKAAGVMSPNDQKVTYWVPDKHAPLLIEIETFKNLVIAIAPRMPYDGEVKK